MADVGEIRVRLGADVSDLTRGLTEAQRQVVRFGESAAEIGKTLSTRVTAPIAAVGALSAIAFNKQAQAVAGVESRLRRFGDAAQEMSAKYQAEASRLQGVSLFGDEEILRGVTGQLLTFGNVTGDVFDRAQVAALDLSATLGQDLQSSAIQLGKALNDPVRGVTALQRVGITFSDSQKETIKTLQESGRLMEAQGVILQEIETYYGGAASAAAAAGTGGFTQAKNAIGDALESIGAAVTGVFLPAANAVKVGAERFKAAFDGLSEPMKRSAVALATFAAVVPPVLVAVGTFAKTLALVRPVLAGLATTLGPVGLALIAFGAVAAVVVANFDAVRAFFVDRFPRATAALGRAFGEVKAAVSRALDGVSDAFESFRPALDAAARLWSRFGETVVRVVDGTFSVVVRFVGDALATLADLVGVFLSVLTGDWAGAFDGVKRVAVRTFAGIASAALQGLGTAAAAIESFLDGIAEVGTVTIGIGLGANSQALVTAGTLINRLGTASADAAGLASKEFDRLRLQLDGVAAAAQAAADAADAVTAPERITGADGPTVAPSGSADTDDAADKARTLAEVVSDLNARLAVARARFGAGLSSGIELARVKAQALAAAFEDAFRVAGNRLTPAVSDLRDRAREAALAVEGFRRIGRGDAARPLASLDGLAELDKAAGPLARVRAGIASVSDAIRDVPVPAFAGSLDGIGPTAARAFQTARAAALQFADALSSGVARAVADVGAAISASIFGDAGLDLAVLDAQDALVRLNEEFQNGEISAERFALETEVAEQRLADLAAQASPIKAAVSGIASAFKSAMAQVIAAIVAAIVKAAALKLILAAFGGPTASFGSLFVSSLGANGASLTSSVSGPSVTAAPAVRAPAQSSAVAFGSPRPNNGRGVLEIPYEAIGYANVQFTQRAQASGAGLPNVGGVVAS